MNIAFIPIRKGSKGIVNKNQKILYNQPLFYYTLKAALNSKYIDKVVLATDDNELIENFNFSKFINYNKLELYRRLDENAQDHSTTESVILEYLSFKNLSPLDVFLLVQATSPLTTEFDISNIILKYNSSEHDSILSVVKAPGFFWSSDGTSLNYDWRSRPRRQKVTNQTFKENGALYVTTIGKIINSKNRLNGSIGFYIMKDYQGLDIDDISDFKNAEKLMYKHIISKKTNPAIKLFFSDLDGTLTDAGMYYGNNGEEFKKFNTHDGKGFKLLRKAGIKTGIFTSENTNIVANRAKKLQLEYVYQGLQHIEKLKIVKEICKKENILLSEVAYIGDDINCLELLQNVGLPACPKNSQEAIKNLPGIILLKKNRGDGAVREFVNIVLGL